MSIDVKTEIDPVYDEFTTSWCSTHMSVIIIKLLQWCCEKDTPKAFKVLITYKEKIEII